MRPRPVAYMVKVSPRCTGFEGVTTNPFELRTTVAMPVSGPATLLRKTLGAAGRMVTLKASLTPPGVRNSNWVFPSIAKGSCALIWLWRNEHYRHRLTVDRQACVAENGRQRNLPGRLADGAQVGAVDGDQSAGRDGLCSIGGIDDAIKARRRGRRRRNSTEIRLTPKWSKPRSRFDWRAAPECG